MYNRYNLLGLLLRLEPHIPEHVVDQMNDVLVQNWHFLDECSLWRVSETKRAESHTKTGTESTKDTLTHRFDLRGVHQGSFHTWDAILAFPSISQGKDPPPYRGPETEDTFYEMQHEISDIRHLIEIIDIRHMRIMHKMNETLSAWVSVLNSTGMYR